MADINDEVNQWLSYAEQDWLYALSGLEMFPRPASWSLQQAAEKYLKALLLYLDKEPPRSHDLLFLLTLSDLACSDELRDAVAEMNAYGPTRRYPGDFLEITLEEAQSAKAATGVVRDWVKKQLDIEM